MNIERVNSELRRQIAVIIDGGEIKDPRLSGMVSVVAVKTAKDLGSAVVYVSVLDGEVNEVVDALKNSAGFIRNIVKNKIKIRKVPELRFQADTSMEYGIKMEKLIKETLNE